MEDHEVFDIPFAFINVGKPKKEDHKIQLPMQQIVGSTIHKSSTNPNNLSMIDSMKDLRSAYITPNEADGSVVSLHFLCLEDVKGLILNPFMFKDDRSALVCVRNNGTIEPSFLPDLSDLALVPKALKLFLKWSMEKEKTIPWLVRGLMLVTSQVLPEVRRVTNFMGRELEFHMYSYTNDLQMITTQVGYNSTVKVSMHWVDVSTERLDGRKCLCKVTRLENSNEEIEGFHRVGVENAKVEIMFWNCRGMGRPSFLTHFQHLTETNCPDIICLTESRISVAFLRCFATKFNLYRVIGVSPRNLYGGVVVLSRHNRLHFITGTKGEFEISGQIVGKRWGMCA